MSGEPAGKNRTRLGAPRLNVTKRDDGLYTYLCTVCLFESKGHKRQQDGIDARKAHMNEIKVLKERKFHGDEFNEHDSYMLRKHQETYR